MNKLYKVFTRVGQVFLLISAALFIIVATQGDYRGVPIAILCIFSAWYSEHLLKGMK